MNNFEIKENGKIILNPKHQGMNTRSLRFFEIQFAAYALQKRLQWKECGATKEIYWLNGGVKWDLPTLNAVANYMGIVKFFMSLRDNTGGSEYKYDQSILYALTHREHKEIGGYPPEKSLEFLSNIGYRGTFTSTPPFQQIGEEGYFEIKITPNGVTSSWTEI